MSTPKPGSQDGTPDPYTLTGWPELGRQLQGLSDWDLMLRQKKELTHLEILPGESWELYAEGWYEEMDPDTDTPEE